MCNPARQANGAGPGECFWYTKFPRYRIGIVMHLATILPAAILVVFQFIPAIRHRFVLYHKIAGHVIILLTLVTIAATIMIADQTMGGHLSTQAAVGFLSIIVLVGLSLAYYNIKRKQIDQHRAWMLRTWIWLGSIITIRFISILTSLIYSLPSYYRPIYEAMPCPKLLWILENYNQTFSNVSDTAIELGNLYPTCSGQATNLSTSAIVQATMHGGAENIGASLNAGFGMSIWLGLAIHMVAVEIYLHLTPKEAERLRRFSYQRQLEAGFQNPGSAGLVAERIGDADAWVMRDERGTEVVSRKSSDGRDPLASRLESE